MAQMAGDIHLLVDASGAGVRLDSYLGAQDCCPSRSACAHLIDAGAVAVNGETCLSKKYAVVAGDRISVELPEPRDPGVVEPDNIPLDIRYEDDYLIVLSKQRGLVCHPAQGHDRGTLANALVYHCGIDHLGTLQGEDRPGIVHRLDRDTSGLMLAAKDDATQRALQDLIRLRTLDRRYIALVHGYIAHDEGTIDTGIARSTRDRVKMAVSDDPFARQAITTFRVLERFDAGRPTTATPLWNAISIPGARIRFACICGTSTIRSWGIPSTARAKVPSAPIEASHGSSCIRGGSVSPIP